MKALGYDSLLQEARLTAAVRKVLTHPQTNESSYTLDLTTKAVTSVRTRDPLARLESGELPNVMALDALNFQHCGEQCFCIEGLACC